MTASKKMEGVRKPNACRFTATSLIAIYMVWCIVVPTLTTTGHLNSIQSVECTDDAEFQERRNYDLRIVCLWSSLNLGLCLILLLDLWIKNEFHHIQVILGVIGTAIAMICTFDNMQKKEMQGMENLKNRYLALLPLTHRTTTNNCDMVTNVLHWQTEFKCCGLDSYQDWSSVIPDSCSCEGEDDKSGCVGVGDIFVYEKPCLPIVLSLAAKQRSTFQIITTIWVVIAGSPLAIFMLFLAIGLIGIIYFFGVTSNCCCDLKLWLDKIFGRKKVPVVFIRKNNNNQTEENMPEQHSVTDDNVSHCDRNDNPVIKIPQSLLRRFQEELDPPPVQHRVRNEKCMCIDPPPPRVRSFYTILVDDDSPLLPNNAVLVDADKPTQYCFWKEGHRGYEVKEIIWPHVKTQDTSDVTLSV